MQANPVRKSPPESGFWGVTAGATVHCVTLAEFPHLSDGRQWRGLSHGAAVRVKWATYSTQRLPHGYRPTCAAVSSIKLFRSAVSDSLGPHGLQHARPPCPSPTPEVHPNSCPSSLWCHPTISSVVPSPPALNLSQHQGLFQWVSSSHQVAQVLEFQLQHQSFQWTPRTDLL